MRKLTIEQFLTWAFTEELPKIGATQIGGGGSGGGAHFDEMSELGVLIDRDPNNYGVIPDIVWAGEPHPDAVLAGDAVRALAGRRGFEVGEGWNPFPEWDDPHGLIAEEVAMVREAISLRSDRINGEHVVSLVIRAALLGKGPDWTADQPDVEKVDHKGMPAWFVMRATKDALGRSYTYETDGFDRKKRRPVKGAYNKFRLSNGLRGEVLARLDWQLWRDALDCLHRELSGQITCTDLLPFRRHMQPWAASTSPVISSQVIEKAA